MIKDNAQDSQNGGDDGFSYLEVAYRVLQSYESDTDRKVNSTYKTLTDTVSSGRLCHAYLLYGDIGVGKKTIARLFAMAVLCSKNANNDTINLLDNGAKEQNIKDLDYPIPCFSCNSCKKFLSCNHPDYFEFEEKQAKRSLHIEKIRTLRKDAYVMPNESAYRVYLIPRAENMTIESANAFLKLLEEPPKHSIFILTTTDKKSVVSTILSRCIPFAVNPFSVERCYTILRDIFIDVEDDRLKRCSALADGNIGRAKEYLLNPQVIQMEQLSGNVFSYIQTSNGYDLLKDMTNSIKSRGDFIVLTDCMIQSLRLALLSKGGNINGFSGNAVTDRFSYSTLCRILELLMDAKKQLEQNVNQNLLINWLCSSLLNVEYKKA